MKHCNMLKCETGVLHLMTFQLIPQFHTLTYYSVSLCSIKL
nr:MAG TPA: hypothetical protein [Caudoviricetes sp.]